MVIVVHSDTARDASRVNAAPEATDVITSSRRPRDDTSLPERTREDPSGAERSSSGDERRIAHAVSERGRVEPRAQKHCGDGGGAGAKRVCQRSGSSSILGLGKEMSAPSGGGCTRNQNQQTGVQGTRALVVGWSKQRHDAHWMRHTLRECTRGRGVCPRFQLRLPFLGLQVERYKLRVSPPRGWGSQGGRLLLPCPGTKLAHFKTPCVRLPRPQVSGGGDYCYSSETDFKLHSRVEPEGVE